MTEHPPYTPAEIAAHMLQNRRVLQGISPEVYAQNQRIFGALEGLVVAEVTEDVVAAQAVGSRIKGYSIVGSDLDLVVVSDLSRAPDSDFRHRLSGRLWQEFDVRCEHGQAGFIDPDDLMSHRVPGSADDLMRAISDRPDTIVYLFEKPITESARLDTLRAAALKGLRRGLSETDRTLSWTSIRETHGDLYLGTDIEAIQEKIIERLEDALDFYWADEGTEDLKTDVKRHITQALLSERLRRFGLPRSVEDSSLDDSLPASVAEAKTGTLGEYRGLYEDVVALIG